MKICLLTSVLLSATPVIYALPTLLVKAPQIFSDIPLSHDLDAIKSSDLLQNNKLSIGSGSRGKSHDGNDKNIAVDIGAGIIEGDAESGKEKRGLLGGVDLGDVKVGDTVALNIEGEVELGGDGNSGEEKSGKEKEKRAIADGHDSDDFKFADDVVFTSKEDMKGKRGLLDGLNLGDIKLGDTAALNVDLAIELSEDEESDDEESDDEESEDKKSRKEKRALLDGLELDDIKLGDNVPLKVEGEVELGEEEESEK
ncbi:hypothetical protein BZA77DRAFT_294881 [Pyronema omphalodes]|nr:hypothetical protein BZA77DRAFT_294881 [Pyronema omphalodes]